MSKSPAMENLLEAVGNVAFGRSRKECFEKGICIDCGKTAKDFRDPVSVKEYTMSAMCQKCQDAFFTG